MHSANTLNDTIAAIATPAGEGGIAIVRVSGPVARDVLERCFRRKRGGPFAPGRLCYGHILNGRGEVIDEAMAVLMKAPNSYTAQDVCELHCHGGRVAANAALSAVLNLNVRLAQPGEFTRRAFQNGRIDLSEAEAVMALIRAGSDAAARSALHQLDGGVSRFVARVSDALLQLIATIEAANDFPEEIEDDIARSEVLSGIADIDAQLERAADERAARIVRDGIGVVLTGAPNVGKSSLMNALLDRERAIVTPAPGTTRDVLTETLHIGGIAIELSDTAGIRSACDPVERIGVERARAASRGADVVLSVFDASRELTDDDRALLDGADARTITVLNKIDIAIPGHPLRGVPGTVGVSAETGAGLGDLIERIGARAQASNPSEHLMTAQRHIECAKAARSALNRAKTALEDGFPTDVAAIDLMDALHQMTDITGANATEDVIDRIFSQFCVGK